MLLCSLLGPDAAGQAGDAAVGATSQAIPIAPPDPAAAQVADGFQVEVALAGLTYPSSIEFDDAGNTFIAESGGSYGQYLFPARILRVAPSGEIEVVTEQLISPVNDLLWANGRLYISHRGKISVLEGSNVRNLVQGLPSFGDYQNNQMTLGPGGKIYFGQGTASNSGVVGLDNWSWLWQHPQVHDVPAHDIWLRGQQFTTLNPLAPTLNTTNTGAFQPFGEVAPYDPTIPGKIKSNGTILRMDPDGANLEVYAWGLRNPFGVMWSPDPQLYASEQGFQSRGSRPIANDQEDLYAIAPGAWHGWPDYASGIPVTHPRFQPTNGPAPLFLLRNHPEVVKPLITFPRRQMAMKIDFSPNRTFGYPEHLFLAFFGTIGADDSSIVRINLHNQRVEDFFSVKPASALPVASVGRQDVIPWGPKRLIDVRFSLPGDALYVVDYGAVIATESGVVAQPHTGVIWKITSTE